MQHAFGEVTDWPNRARRRTAFVLAFSTFTAVGLSGCGVSISVPAYTVAHPPPAGHLIAGVSKVDITPPAGYPMGGHSLGGRASRGHWGRLYARAFYFRDADGNSVAFVTTDLFAVAGGLQEDAASIANLGFPLPTRDKTEQQKQQERSRNAGGSPCQSIRPHPDLGRANVVLAATHAHQSPGNFLSSPFYNGFASQYPGFAKEQFDFLSLRIACAVALAAEDASAHANDPVSLEWSENRNVAGLVRNRAIFSLKRDGEDVIRKLLALGPATEPGCPGGVQDMSDGCLRLRAVDATLTRLTIERGGDAIGAMVFFATHPTALSDHVSVNSPDLAGFAMAWTEERSTKPGKPPFVAGFFNGAEGDVSPRWGRQDSDDAIRLARILEKAVSDATVVQVDPPTSRVSARRAASKQSDFCNGTRPVMGIATLGGAEDGRSFAFDLGWRSEERSGLRRKSSLQGLYESIHKDQAPKIPGLDLKDVPGIGLTGLLAPASSYPAEVPVSLVQLGSRSIAAVPFEVTTAAGLDIRERLARQGVDHPLVVGLANEYLSYLATEAEYDEQDYEGASTLYGRKSVDCVVRLISPGNVHPETEVPAREFDAGPPPALDATLGPSFWGRNGQFQDASLESPFLPDGRAQERLPRFEWEHCYEDDGVELLLLTHGTWAREKEEFGGELLVELPEGREGTDAAGHAHSRRWAVLWLAGPGEDPNATHMFRVHPRRYEDGPTGRCEAVPMCSAAFRLADVDAGKPGVLLPGPCP